VPGGTKTDIGQPTTTQASATPSTASKAQAKAVPDGNSYKNTFLKWVSDNLQTRLPGTGFTITLNHLLKPDPKDNLGKELATQLNQALSQVVTTADDKQKNAIAVNNFLTYAVAAVANKSRQIKQKNKQSGSFRDMSPGSNAGGAIVTQQELKDKLNQEVGINLNQVEALKKVAQDPAARRALLKTLGIQA